MRIGDLAREAGVTPKAIRYYESLGLVVAARSANGYRDYGAGDVRVVRELRRLIELGIPAARTRPFLDCLADHDEIDDCPSSLAEYRDAIGDLDRRIRELTRRREALGRRLEMAACRRPGRGGACDEDDDLHHEEASVDDHNSLPLDLPVPADDGAADHLPGLALPELTLPSTAGTESNASTGDTDSTVSGADTNSTGADISLTALGKARTVLYIYPLTGHPHEDVPEGWNSIPGARGCTAEACDFRDHHRELLEAGAADVFGLSSQDTPYQQELVERLRLPFAMLSDPGFALAEALRLPTFEFRGRRLYKRITLIVRDGVVEHCFYPVFPPNRHAGEVLAWLAENPLEVPLVEPAD